MMAIAIFGTLTVIIGTVLFLMLKANQAEEHDETGKHDEE
jgi:hypothetical protein